MPLERASVRLPMGDPSRASRAATAGPHVAQLYEDLAALEMRGLTALFARGFELPQQPWIAPGDTAALRAWEGECIKEARQWLQRQSPRLQVDETAVALLSCIHQLRRSIESEVSDDVSHVLKWAVIAQNGRAVGHAELLFAQAQDGLFVIVERAVQAQSARSESVKRINDNQSSWHEYAFALIAAKRFLDPTIPQKTLNYWVVERVNARQLELGSRLVTESAIEKAVARKPALFDAIRVDVDRDVANAMREAASEPSPEEDV